MLPHYRHSLYDCLVPVSMKASDSGCYHSIPWHLQENTSFVLTKATRGESLALQLKEKERLVLTPESPGITRPSESTHTRKTIDEPQPITMTKEIQISPTNLWLFVSFSSPRCSRQYQSLWKTEPNCSARVPLALLCARKVDSGSA